MSFKRELNIVCEFRRKAQFTTFVFGVRRPRVKLPLKSPPFVPFGGRKTVERTPINRLHLSDFWPKFGLKLGSNFSARRILARGFSEGAHNYRAWGNIKV